MKSTEKSIGKIGNYYGRLFVKKYDGKYFWGIGDWCETNWEEIPEDFYNSLISFEKKRLRNLRAKDNQSNKQQ